MFFDAFIPKGKQQKKLQDHEEYMAKKELLVENAKLTKQLNELNSKCDVRNKDLLTHFIKSSMKESQLKDYVNELTDKLFEGDIKYATEYDKKICELHSEIIQTIENIQEKVRREIEKTKSEMEKELGERFAEAEAKQKKLMDIKVDQQKKVFDRMNYTRGELEKIVKKFAETNNTCEKLAKENEQLKLDLETSINLNKMLEKQLVKLQKENNRVESDYNNIANNIIEEASLNDNTLKNKEKIKNISYKKVNNAVDSMKNKPIENPYVIFNNNNNSNVEKISRPKTAAKKDIILGNSRRVMSFDKKDENLTPNQIEIKKLKNELDKAKKEYYIVYQKYIEGQKTKTDAQQLLQKCIEDIQIQLSQTNLKYNDQSQSGNLSEYEKENILQTIQSLEQKLKVLTYIYDNGIQNLKSHKTGLFYK